MSTSAIRFLLISTAYVWPFGLGWAARVDPRPSFQGSLDPPGSHQTHSGEVRRAWALDVQTWVRILALHHLHVFSTVKYPTHREGQREYNT